MILVRLFVTGRNTGPAASAPWISTPHIDQPASLGKVLTQFGPVLVHGAASRPGMGRFSVSRPRNPQKCRLSNRFRRHFSLPPSRHQNLLRSAGRLSGWHRWQND